MEDKPHLDIISSEDLLFGIEKKSTEPFSYLKESILLSQLDSKVVEEEESKYEEVPIV